MAARAPHRDLAILQARERGKTMPSRSRKRVIRMPPPRVRVAVLDADNREEVELLAMLLGASLLAILAAFLR